MQKMKAITRREMFKELVSKDNIRLVAGAWYGFTQPLREEPNNEMKPESLMDIVKKKEARFAKKVMNDRKEG